MNSKSFLATGTALLLLYSNMSSTYASEYNVAGNWENQISVELENHLSTYYEGIYTLSDFSIAYDNVTESSTTLSADATVTVNMALSRNPAESPFVLGIQSVKTNSTNAVEQESLQEIIDAYLTDVLPYYQVPNETTFAYHIDMQSGSQSQIYNCYFNGEGPPYM